MESSFRVRQMLESSSAQSNFPVYPNLTAYLSLFKLQGVGFVLRKGVQWTPPCETELMSWVLCLKILCRTSVLYARKGTFNQVLDREHSYSANAVRCVRTAV